jgi:hypothetical protein
LDEVAELVRSRICASCQVRVEACEEGPALRCVLLDLFPLVVQAILATESDSLEDYRQAVWENVCSVCVDAALDGSCELRDQVRCALDLYLADIVEVVRQAYAADTLASPGAGG